MNFKTDFQEISVLIRDKLRMHQHTPGGIDLDVEELKDIIVELACRVHKLEDDNAKLQRNLLALCRVLYKAGIVDDIEIITVDGNKEKLINSFRESEIKNDKNKSGKK